MKKIAFERAVWRTFGFGVVLSFAGAGLSFVPNRPDPAGITALVMGLCCIAVAAAGMAFFAVKGSNGEDE